MSCSTASKLSLSELFLQLSDQFKKLEKLPELEEKAELEKLVIEEKDKIIKKLQKRIKQLEGQVAVSETTIRGLREEIVRTKETEANARSDLAIVCKRESESIQREIRLKKKLASLPGKLEKQKRLAELKAKYSS